jgi:hypothetical protein
MMDSFVGRKNPKRLNQPRDPDITASSSMNWGYDNNNSAQQDPVSTTTLFRIALCASV